MGREDEDKDDSGTIYKTKVVDFLGRQVPIVLQNDNGPCPLLAICKNLTFFFSCICCTICVPWSRYLFDG